MSTVTFENGKTVEFDGTPTQADIDEVASKFGNQPPPDSSQPPPDNRNIVQRVAGAVADPFVTMATRTGQAAGALIGSGVNAIAGHQVFDLDKGANAPTQVPFLGTNVKPISQETPESVGGEALGTVGLGAGPLTGGAMLGASAAMQENDGLGMVGLNAVVGAVVGKLSDLGFEKLAPIISDAIAKYGSKAINEFKSQLPEYAQPYLDKLVQNTVGKLPVHMSPKMNESSAIEEMISPKINAKETQNIVREGRLTRGNSSVLFGKRPDIVAQSEAVKEAAEVIQRTIPGASKMDDATLSTSLRSAIKDSAESLKPEMKATPVTQETTGKVVDAWKSLKVEQQTRPEFLDNEAGNRAFQGKFENYLKQLNWDIINPETGKFQTPTQKTMDDIWQARIEYDSSVPPNVKNATTQSNPALQTRKEMWLENRAILNAAIKDTSTGLGKEAQQAFSDMSSMYDARQNIATKVKIDLTGRVGLLPKNKEELLKWGIGAGLTLTGGDYLLHKIGIHPFGL